MQLGDGEELDRVNFNLPRGSVVAGRVLDEDGEPLALASVLVFQYVYRQGQRVLVPRGADRSDDRGQYLVRARSQAQRGASPLFTSDQVTVAGQDVSDLLLEPTSRAR